MLKHSTTCYGAQLYYSENQIFPKEDEKSMQIAQAYMKIQSSIMVS